MKVETKVGLLFLSSCFLVIGFAYYLGALNPFSNTNDVHLLYNFAGGIEVGSPVRVMGIKVGKVKDIEFRPDAKDKKGNEVKLKVTISVDKKAWATVREDSKFYINLAGVIGEKYVEITPGTLSVPELKKGGTYRGQDPPRIDQLISQSYSLAGKVLEFVEKNEGDVVSIIKTLDALVSNFNKTIVMLDKLTKDGTTTLFVKNINQIAGDVAAVTHRLRSKDTAKTIDLLHELVWRLGDLDKEAIKKFLQEEGIKARLL